MLLRPQSDLHGYASRPAEFLLGNVVDKPNGLRCDRLSL